MQKLKILVIGAHDYDFGGGMKRWRMTLGGDPEVVQSGPADHMSSKRSILAVVTTTVTFTIDIQNHIQWLIYKNFKWSV